MSCPGCGHENRPGRKFCVDCGAALALACAACSAPYEAGEKFCGECGAPLGAAAPRPAAGVEDPNPASAAAGRPPMDAGARKVVTIVFADLVGSTALHERLDAESARRVMERYYDALRTVVDAHGGTVVKLLGDGVMAAFGLKRVAEDDALRAVRAAAAMQEAFQALIRTEAAVLGSAGLRVAVNTGEVVVSGARDDVIGDPVNVAARLQEQGSVGDVVLGEATRRLVATRVTLAPLGSVTLKGRAEAVAAYRLASLEPPAGGAAAPFVGRESELARLEAVYDTAVATPATRMAVLLGSPGLGKSRLIDELGSRHADGATILVAHCDAAGGATFAPLAQVLRGFLGVDESAAADAVRTAVAGALAGGDDGERARIAGGIAGLLGGTATSPEETFFVVRRFLAGLAAVRPVVVVIDDLHWAEPLLVDLVEHLVQWGAGVPLFVLVGARPELRDLRSSLVIPGALVADVVTLGGLDAGAAMRLAANVIGAADLPAAVAAKVLATSEGNPLFVGELVRMLVQEGALTKDGDRWIVGAGLAALEMPPTIHALLAARIERLGSEDRTVLERASVVGRHFSRSAVAALLGRNGTALDTCLESLRRGELIERDTGWLLGEPVMRFHHVLIRDAAYRRLLKGTRAELHARLADWIEGQIGDAPEHDEMIGWHLEQAHQLLGELGAIDAAGAALGERAARRLAAAGRRALARDDVSLAAGLLGRALHRLIAAAPERADLVLDWCEALLAAGDVGPAADAIAELDHVAGDASNRVAGDASNGVAGDPAASPRLRAWHTCFAGQLTVMTAPEALHATADRVGAAARELAALGDAAGEAKAHFVHAQALARLGKIGASEAALDQALAAARRAGDRRRANAVLAGAPLAALWGPSPVTRASGRCLDVVRVLRITQGAPAVEAVALSCQGVLEALRGRSEAARRMLASSRTMVEELGISHRLFETDVFAGRIDLLEGDAPAAERALRAGYDGLRDLGLGIDAARAAALLGRALLAQDRPAEAETLSHESELLAGDDLQAAIAWRGVRAEALARRGDHAAAITLAEAAVAIAAATDALLDHADARLALAAALRAGGRQAEADAEERRAFELWEAKGATVLADRARRAPAGEVPAAPRRETRTEPRVQRRIRPSTATVTMARVDAALAARDLPAMGTFADSFEEVSHPTGTSYGREQMMRSLEHFVRLPGAWVRHEVLATLGDTLVLVRRWMGASAAGRERFDVGEYEKEEVAVFQIDTHGIHLRTEIFGADHLGEAIATLFQRYAGTLRRGPEQERAAVAARAAGYILIPGVATPDLSLLYAPTYVDIDHRTVGYGTLAREDSQKLFRSLQDIADGMRFHIDDVLALTSQGLVRTTTTGVWREGGGTFERTVCTLNVFGPDGRVTHHETFDAEREAEALARFDALTVAGQPKHHVQRRVRPNAVTRASAEFEGIVAARDFAALEIFFTEDAVCVDHPTGATYGAEEMRTGVGRLMQSPDARLRFIPLATLGESWGLVRREMSASGVGGGRFDVGAYEIVDVAIYGTEGHGRMHHVEIFAAERLGNAVARLYECWADSLPEGAARMRAHGCARALATFAGPLAADRMATSHAPSFECVDHRTLGTWSAHGLDEWLTHWRGQADLADGFTVRADDVLALVPAAIVFRSTYFGRSRASGGYFENVVLALNLFDADGFLTRSEIFEPDQEVEALACFDAITAPALPSLGRRMRANAATATSERLWAAIARRDAEAFGRELADDFELVHHPTAASYGRRGMLATWRSLLKAKHFAYDPVVLATLGEALVLHRHTLSAEGFVEERLAVAGRIEMDEVVVDEIDADGRFRHMELFSGERLGDAIACAYARHAERLPAGPARERALMTARAATAMLTRSDKDRLEDVSTPDIVAVDHRAVGMGTVTGSDPQRDDKPTYRVEDVLALSPDGLLRRTTQAGTARASGGAFENSIWILSIFGRDGRQSRVELFDVGREADALARFDELTTTPAVATRPVARRVRPNAASVCAARFADAFAAGDTDALTALWVDALEVVDHPNAATYGREGHLASIRRLQRARAPQLTFELLASLGDTVCLTRRRIATQGTVGGRFDVGASEHDALVLFQVDASSRCRRVEIFAAGHLDDACIRLYDRHAEQLPDGRARARASGAARACATMVAAAAAGDPERFTAALSPVIAIVDHRRLGLPPARGTAEALALLRSMFDVADATIRIEDVLALAPDGLLWRVTVAGTDRTSDAVFEMSALVLWIFDADGLLARYEAFDVGGEAEALARFDALVGGVDRTPAPSAEPFGNAASATVAPVMDAIVAHDWDGFARCLADDFRMFDHRRVVQLEFDRDEYITFTRSVSDGRSIQARSALLATRGEQLALARSTYEFRDADVGPSEIAFLLLTEVDARGRVVAYVRWDVDDLAAAYVELDRRWHADAQASHPRVAAFHVAVTRALAARDWDGMAVLMTPTLAAHDHRLVGWDVRHGPDAYLDVVRAMVELAPDANGRLDHARAGERGFLAEVVWVGTRDGGDFESPFVWVVELDDAAVATRFDFYDPHHLDAARTRFAEIETPAPLPTPFPIVATPAAVIAAVGRWQTTFEMSAGSDDWDPMRAICSPTMVWDDRRRFAQIAGDRELFIATLRERVAIGARFSRRVLGTAGDRVGIFDVLFSGGPSDGPFEIEFLCVFAVDEAGLLTAMVCFDLDDPHAALREAWARWAAIDPVVAPWAKLIDALNGKTTEHLAGDLVVEDHRRAGFGRIEGAGEHVASLAALWELAPEQRHVFGWSWYAVDRHAAVVSVRREGTLPDGGAFESDDLALVAATEGVVTRLELFETGARDRALARFAELRPDPLRIPPNAATRWRDRWCARGGARDREGLARLYAPTATLDDRRRLLRVSGDRALLIASAQHIHESGQVRIARTLLATAGDRLVLERLSFHGGKPGADFAIDLLSVLEVDANGLALAIVNFDLDDRAAASAELFERYAASDGCDMPGITLDTVRAWNAHDLEHLRALLPADFYLDDRRRTGVGRLDGIDLYLTSLAALWELSRDLKLEPLYLLAVEPHGTLYVCRWYGTNAEGGDLDAVYVCLGLNRGDRPAGLEIFELDDLQLARARFAELHRTLV